jgi:hypothetical protein
MMLLKRRRSPAAARQCARRSGNHNIDGEGCGADVEALTAEAMAAEAMPLIQAHCQAGPREKRAVIFSVRRDAFQAKYAPSFRRRGRPCHDALPRWRRYQTYFRSGLTQTDAWRCP